MAHLQYMPGDPRLVDQLVYELKSKGIFDQFRKECIADVDTRPAYQNLRQRVETSVSTFLSRQTWRPDLNKNQLREKLRKHILDGNYLEQGVERIVDQVVNPKVASVFIPQVEDLVYNYLGIPRKKAEPETSEIKNPDLLPEDLEAVSPGSVKSNDDKNEEETEEQKEKTEKMEVEEAKPEVDDKTTIDIEKQEIQDVQMAEVTVVSNDSGSMDKSSIPLPAEEIKLESIPAPVNSPPKVTKVELDSIALPHEPNLSTDIPLPDEVVKEESNTFFRPIQLNSEDSNSTSDSSIIRNMSPLTPIRNFNNENSCDAQQGFDDGSDEKSKEKVPSSFRFTIENNDKTDNVKPEKKEEQTDLAHQFNNQVNINTFNTPMYDDSSNSNNLHIDYESDVNSKTNTEIKPEGENSQDSKKDKKDDKKSHKSSHRSRDSSRHSSSKDKRSDSKHSTSRDSSRHDKKSSSKDDKNKSSKDRERSKDRSDRKDSRDSSKQRSSHKSSSKDKDSKSHRSSSSSHRHSKSSDDKKTPSKESSKEKHSESSRDKSKDKSKDSKSSSHRSDKDKKSSSKKPDDKSKKKDKRDIDDHYSSSGRGNHSRRSTDRDSNDGSSSSKGSQNQNGSKSSDTKKDNKSSSKSDNTSISGDSASPSDKDTVVQDNSKISQFKPVIRVDNHLEVPIANPPRLPFVPDVTLKKPRFAANLQEAKKLMKMRKFLDEEQKRMNQEAALLLEFQANVRPSLSQVYSSIPGPELEFACGNVAQDSCEVNETVKNEQDNIQNSEVKVKEEKPLESEVKDMESPNNVNIIIDLPKTGIIEDKLEESIIPDNPESPDAQHDLSYDENKPFSELMAEITEYSKASETKTKTEIDEIMEEIESTNDKEDSAISDDDDKEKKEPAEDVEKDQTSVLRRTLEDSVDIIESKATTESESIENKYFEVTIITEVLSESDETEIGIINEESVDTVIENEENIQTENVVSQEEHIEIQSETRETKEQNIEPDKIPATPSDNELQYFAEHDKYNAEIERHEFSNFLKSYIENLHTSKKMYLINCDTYEENIIKEIASTFGDYEVINYHKNGHTKLPNTPKNVVKDVKLSSEVILPIEPFRSPIFSPVKSECSFELSSDYDTKLDDINKKSRQEVMEIILGTIVDASPSKMPKIDYYTECSSETEIERDESQSEIELSNSTVESETENSLKRRIDEVESSLNNNRSVLTPNKIRKMSDSDQISSTTEETEESSNNNKVIHTTRSKYLGRARRVGLSRPKRCNQSNSPSSDKSVENYSQNTTTPNGKIKSTPRTKVQRYDTSDLYKPKLHYLSRRNNVS